MKKNLIVLFLSLAGFISHSQPIETLKSIANILINNETYQAACEYTFSVPFGDTLTCEVFINTMKVPTDNFCGFYYNFLTAENYRNENFLDFTMYFDSTVYSSYLGVVEKTSYHESPSQFIEIKLDNMLIPAIQKKTFFYSITPYEIGQSIIDLTNDPHMVITQIPDTIIELDTCLRFILESKSDIPNFDRKNPEHWKKGKVIYEMCFNTSGYYPVFYKKEVFTPIVNDLEIAQFRNTTYNQKFADNYFTEKNLLPENWEKTDEATKKEEKSPYDLVGKKAPEWNLPVMGTETTFSSENLRGKTTLVEFTATWCGACYKAAEMMNRLETQFENNDEIEIISIYSSNLDSKESIERFITKLNAKSIILYAASNIEKEYNVYGYPKFFILSPKGIITKCIPGYSSAIEQEIIDALSNVGE